MSDDFYIGYRKTAPAALARFVRIATFGIVVTTCATAALIGALQQPAGKGKYEFGTTTEFNATILADPVPHAIVHTEDNALVGDRTALLVARGKHGVEEETFADGAKAVRFMGTRIERDDVRMIELADDEKFEAIANVPVQNSSGNPQEIALEGELIDTKCYLGVMNPAEGKVHRACAVVCLRGGVPPGLMVRDASGHARVIVLNVRSEGGPDLNPEWAGRVVRVSGALEDLSGLPILRARTIALR